MNTIDPFSLAPVLQRLRPHLIAAGQPVYLVGGTVRDAVLGRAIHDIDLVVAADAVPLTFRLADALGLPAYILDAERDVGRIIVSEDSLTIDIARFRGPSLEEDLYGRDFTINALAMPLAGESAGVIIDRHNGLDDLQAGRLNIIHPRSIAEDPVRALRAARFAASFGFTLTDGTVTAIMDAGPLLSSSASPERVRDEVTRLLTCGAPHRAVQTLHKLNLLAVTLPDIAALDRVSQSPPHHEDVLAHTISVLRYQSAVERIVDGNAGASLWEAAVATLLEPYRDGLRGHLDSVVDGGYSGRAMFMWGGLLHDVGKAPTQSTDPDGRIRFFQHDEVGAEMAGRILTALSFSNEAVRRIRTIVGGHMRPLYLATEKRIPSRRTTYRYFRALHEAGLDVGLLTLADHLATHNGTGDDSGWEALLLVVDSLFETYFTRYEETIAPTRLLDGREIMSELGIPPGHEIGRLLRLLEEAQASGDLSTREQAIAFIRQETIRP